MAFSWSLKMFHLNSEKQRVKENTLNHYFWEPSYLLQNNNNVHAVLTGLHCSGFKLQHLLGGQAPLLPSIQEVKGLLPAESMM
jgi:hypothetical protein